MVWPADGPQGSAPEGGQDILAGRVGQVLGQVLQRALVREDGLQSRRHETSRHLMSAHA